MLMQAPFTILLSPRRLARAEDARKLSCISPPPLLSVFVRASDVVAPRQIRHPRRGYFAVEPERLVMHALRMAMLRRQSPNTGGLPLQLWTTE